MRATATAARVLRDVLEHDRPLGAALEGVLKRHAPHPGAWENRRQQGTPGRAWLQEVCYGVARHWVLLEALLERLAERDPARLDGAVRALLLVGLYRLWQLRDPPYAAVHTTVEACTVLRRAPARGLVNAVLRRFQREGARHLTKLRQRPELEHLHPAWLLQATRTAWPRHWEQVLAANNRQAPLWLRVNRRRTTRADYRRKLASAGYPALAPPHPAQALLLERSAVPGSLPGFAAGCCSVQDGGAQFACRALCPKPGLRVLDACAAPGGKGAHLLECTPQLGELVALEQSPARLAVLRQTLVRLGLQATLAQADATRPDDWWDGRPFDRVLLDVPCSGTGVIRRRPDIKLRKNPRVLEGLVRLQHRLLQALWGVLAPGGLLLYVTCSYLPEENDGPVGRLLAAHPEAGRVALRIPHSLPTRHGYQLLPGTGNMDGFYYALLARA